MAPTREEQLVETFVELADTLVDDFDVIDFLQMLTRRVTELVDAAEAGILLADPQGTLQLMASSSEQTRALELFLLQNDQGPCLDCYRTGQPVIVEDLDIELQRWPRFVPEARKDGFAAVHALPLRLRQDLIGVLGVFGAAPGRLSDADISACQGMAHIATISLLSRRAVGRADEIIEQLQYALDSRIVIEQAKGVLAERAGIGTDEAFQRLRRPQPASQRCCPGHRSREPTDRRAPCLPAQRHTLKDQASPTTGAAPLDRSARTPSGDPEGAAQQAVWVRFGLVASRSSAR